MNGKKVIKMFFKNNHVLWLKTVGLVPTKRNATTCNHSVGGGIAKVSNPGIEPGSLQPQCRILTTVRIWPLFTGKSRIHEVELILPAGQIHRLLPPDLFILQHHSVMPIYPWPKVFLKRTLRCISYINFVFPRRIAKEGETNPLWTRLASPISHVIPKNNRKAPCHRPTIPVRTSS